MLLADFYRDEGSGSERAGRVRPCGDAQPAPKRRASSRRRDSLAAGPPRGRHRTLEAGAGCARRAGRTRARSTRRRSSPRSTPSPAAGCCRSCAIRRTRWCAPTSRETATIAPTRCCEPRSARRTTPAAGTDWLIDLSRAAPNQVDTLAAIAKAAWLPDLQRDRVYERIVAVSEETVAREHGAAQASAQAQLDELAPPADPVAGRDEADDARRRTAARAARSDAARARRRRDGARDAHRGGGSRARCAARSLRRARRAGR